MFASFTLHFEVQTSYQPAALGKDMCLCVTVLPNTSAHSDNGLSFKQMLRFLVPVPREDRKCDHKQTRAGYELHKTEQVWT